MKIAVSGANGFIGQYVLQELQARGLDTVALSRRTDPGPQSTACKWVSMDIAAPPADPFEAMGRPDALIHLAWDGLPNYQSDRHVETELPAQLAFLASCVGNGLRRLIVAGTCYEYGLLSGELAEEIETRPCTQYGLAKDTLRKALFDLRTRHDFDLAWLRLFYLYGEGQSEKSLYRLLHTAIDQRADTFDMSGGEQLRDFLAVCDAARLVVEIALRGDVNGIFNVCSGRPVSVRDLVQSWIKTAGVAIAPNFGQLPYSAHEPMAFWGRRQKLDSILDAARRSSGASGG